MAKIELCIEEVQLLLGAVKTQIKMMKEDIRHDEQLKIAKILAVKLNTAIQIELIREGNK